MRARISILVLAGICILQAANPENEKLKANAPTMGNHMVFRETAQSTEAASSHYGLSLLESIKNGAVSCFRPCLGCLCEPTSLARERDIELETTGSNPLQRPDGWVYTTMPPRSPGTDGLRFRGRFTEAEPSTKIHAFPSDLDHTQLATVQASTAPPQPCSSMTALEGGFPDTSSLRSHQFPKLTSIESNSGFEIIGNRFTDESVDLSDARELTEIDRDCDEDIGFILV
jgi:hypothetical protein